MSVKALKWKVEKRRVTAPSCPQTSKEVEHQRLPRTYELQHQAKAWRANRLQTIRLQHPRLEPSPQHAAGKGRDEVDQERCRCASRPREGDLTPAGKIGNEAGGSGERRVGEKGRSRGS